MQTLHPSAERTPQRAPNAPLAEHPTAGSPPDSQALIEEARSRQRRRRWRLGIIGFVILVGALIGIIVVGTVGKGNHTPAPGTAGRPGTAVPPRVAVTGLFRAVGGPAPHGSWPGYSTLSGTIRFVPVSGHGPTRYARAVDGKWRAALPPGMYLAAGRSPGFDSGPDWSPPSVIVVHTAEPIGNVLVAFQMA